MRSHNAAVLAILLFCSVASAFFPLHQVSEQNANRIGGVESDSVINANQHHKRGQLKEDRPGIFISIAPFRSETRYAVRSMPKQRAVKVRDNQYQIFPANPPSQPNSLAIDQDGTDYSYFSTLKIGSKGQTMYMLVDTGSSVTWVMDEGCKSGQCNIHTTFASSQSTTLKKGGPSFSLDYGTGEVSGSYANDTVDFGSFKVTIPLGLADTVSSDFQNYPFDGIMGLGRVPLGGNPSVTLLQEVMNEKLLKANVFGINLQRHSDGTTDGEINFGAPDSSKYQGDLNFVDTVSDKSFWQIPGDDILADGKSVGLNLKRTAILDTGTSYMLLPPDDAKKLFGAIKGAQYTSDGYWNLPCDTKTEIKVVFGGTGYSISPKDYVGKTTSGNTCVSNIIGMSAAGNDQTWLLGDTFLKNVYTLFDADKNRIGFGAKSAASQSSGSSTSTSSSSGGTASSAAASSTSSGGSPSSSGTSGAKPTMTGGPSLPGVQSSKPGSSSAASGSTAAPASSAPAANGGLKLAAGNVLSLAIACGVIMAI